MQSLPCDCICSNKVPTRPAFFLAWAIAAHRLFADTWDGPRFGDRDGEESLRYAFLVAASRPVPRPASMPEQRDQDDDRNRHTKQIEKNRAHENPLIKVSEVPTLELA
jgi:hypothetical protein